MITKPQKRKMNPMLMNVLLISLLVHVVALVVLGGITVVKYIIPDDTEFEEPPSIEEVEPPKEVKVEIKQQPKPQDQPLQNLKMKQVGNIAIANIDVDLPNMEESFTVSGGLGSGGGGLLGGTRGSLGIGMSDVSIFGLKTRAERILFMIDANRQMVTDAKGGLNSYKIIKSEITDMVGNLSAGTLYNVMLYDKSRTMLFKTQLVPAGAQTHQELIQWISGINANGSKIGLEGNRAARKPQLKTLLDDDNVHPALFEPVRGNEIALVTQYALEQDVDAIFCISGNHRGFEELRRSFNEREEAEWQRKISDPEYIKALAAHKAEVPEMQQRVKNALEKINAERRSKGQPPRVLDMRHGIYTAVRELKLKWKNEHPGHKVRPKIDSDVVRKYFKELTETLYDNKNKKVPSVNVVLFLAGDEKFPDSAEDSLKRYVRDFGGKYRIIRGLNEIKGARSASETPN